MISQQTFDVNWNAIKVKLQERWRQLTDSDLPNLFGDMEQLVGVIQRKTGETRAAIESYLHDISNNAACATAKAADYARFATGAAEKTAERTADSVLTGFDEVKRVVRQRPGESLLVCLGVGMIVGVLLSTALRSR